YGSKLKARKYKTQKIELLCKILAYNIERATRSIIEMLYFVRAFLQSRFDINQRLESDLKKNKPSDIYFTLGLQEEDLSFYKGLKSAMRPSPLVEGIYVRTGNFHMFNKETVVEKQEEVIELLKMRKIRQHVRHPIRFMKYANDKFGKEGFYFLGQNIINNNKIFGNPLIKLLLAPLPKYKITFSQGEKLLKRVLGLNLSLVVTKGSVDIDTDEEFESLTAK
ncbi:MAG: hypothetical protein KKH40_06760, partial [Nanoarchaeota archaeon]|nr:hypothetical protein [Nanoarchaeota archaeon]